MGGTIKSGSDSPTSDRKRVTITAAIATLNRPDGLARCLDALLTGAEKPDEIIVVDQGTTDESGPLIASRRAVGVPIRHIVSTDRGLSASRNRAIREATHDVIAMTDDDCVPDASWIQAIRREMESSPAPGAVTGRILPFGPERPGLYAVSSRTSTERQTYHGRALPWRAGSGGNFAVQRTVANAIGMFDLRLGAGSPGKAAEDMDFVYRLLKTGATIVYTPEVVVCHERQPRERRQATRWTYGFGIGALVGKWARKRDRYAATMAFSWLRDQQRNLRHALIARDWTRAGEHLRMLGGAAAGLCYGLRLPKDHAA